MAITSRPDCGERFWKFNGTLAPTTRNFLSRPLVSLPAEGPGSQGVDGAASYLNFGAERVDFGCLPTGATLFVTPGRVVPVKRPGRIASPATSQETPGKDGNS